MNSFYVYEIEGEWYCKDLSEYELWPFFRTVAAELAMDDCTGVRVHVIVWQNKRFEYVGWRPGMEYTFVNVDDEEETYTTWMKEYDH